MATVEREGGLERRLEPLQDQLKWHRLDPTIWGVLVAALVLS